MKKLNDNAAIEKRIDMLKALQSNWFALLFLILGFFAYGLPAVDYFTAVPGDIGDARFNSVILEHLFQWLTQKGTSLWSPTFFYPFRGVLAFSDNHFGSAFAYILFRSLGAGREVAFDSWFLVGISLNIICSYLVIKRLGLNGFSAAAGAFAFTFALPVLAQESHAQLTYRFAIPLAYYAFFEMLETKRLFPFWRVAFWTAVQFFCSIYLGIFLIYLLIASFCGVFFWSRASNFFQEMRVSIVREPIHKKIAFIAILAISTIAVSYLLYRYQSISASYGFKRSPSEIMATLPRISSYFLADHSRLSSWIGGFVTDIPMRHEHQMFFGAGIWALSIYGAAVAWSKSEMKQLAKIALFTFVFMFLFTLNLGGISLYRAISYLPGLSAVRAVTRIALVMLMPISILVAIGTQQLWNKIDIKNMSAKLVFALIIIILLGAEVVTYKIYNTSIAVWAAQQTALKNKLTMPLTADTILYVSGKSSDPSFVTELDGMILAQDMRHPTLNGYSGNAPPNYLDPSPCTSFHNRINAYAKFQELPLAAANVLAARVMVVALENCEHEPIIAGSGKIAASQAEHIQLSLSDITLDQSFLKTKLSIQNNSEADFNTLRSDGPALRVSWRFINEKSKNQELNANWEPRQDMALTIAPKTSASIDLLAILPSLPGNYQFQVSMVQDGVEWFHNMGMKIVSTPITVTTTK
ncbi:hypothetical protein [Undibacterium parvum]|uniref:YfhO family protein n=2 Tax=Undibacterium TaxID=401469 RepID=A0A6M4A632_9BURK|nr:hypothetical protein [Undibacterium parvum]AZP11731.1 hypothetical protein EJN92_06815 [Undibacterium parvum]QJQ06170.1 hypothetical protein EJG51_010225 [Undibacterium piscinae]